MQRIVFALVLLIITAPRLAAFGEHGHYLASEAATLDVPGDMPAFFHQAYPRLVYMGYDPDRWRSGGPSLAAVNPPNHFLDHEYVSHLELPRDRYQFLALLESSGTLERFAIRNTTSGFLPWKVAELHDLLTVQWRLWRASSPHTIERLQIESNIIAIAGELGHYVADAGNPHHSTIHYNGWVDPQPDQFRCSGAGEELRCEPLNPLPFDCGTHSRFESDFVSRVVRLEHVVPHLEPARRRADAFEAIMELLLESNALVRTIYELDRDGAFTGAGTPRGREFAASRIAAGSSLLRDLWWSAWLASGEPPPRRSRN